MIELIMKRCSGLLSIRYRYLMILFVCLAMVCQPALGQMAGAMLAWGKMENNGFNIYFSQRTEQNWSTPKQLSFSDDLEILPTLAANDRREIWVAWTAIKNGDGEINFSHYQNGKWSSPKSIQTQNTADMAPSAIVDGNGDAWLVWAGTDQGDDDIFFSKWENRAWTLPAKVNVDDEWPDILPQLSLTANGMPQVTWSGYDGNCFRSS